MSEKSRPKRAKPAVTSFDVARLAGVSRAVVSRAFTPGSRISKESREKVLTASKELGYRVNHMARALNMQRSDLVGIIAAGLKTPYRSSQIDAFAKHLVNEGFRPILFCIDDTQSAEQLISMLLNYSVAGVIITSDLPPESILNECHDLGTPLVVIDRGQHHPNVDQVTGDNDAGGRLAASTLIAEGRQAYFTLEPEDPVFSVGRRLTAFKDHCSSQNRICTPIVIRDGDYESGRSAAVRFLNHNWKNSGVFCANDLSALGFVDELRTVHQVDIPTDLSIIGYDNIEQADWSFARLTTIEQPIQQIVEETVRLLHSRIENPEAKEKSVVLPVRLVKRDSTL